MMLPLPNVHQAYSLVIQEETQRQMASESTENFSIAAATQSHQSNYSNKPKDKHCEHCNIDSHIIDNYRTLKFYCKFWDKRVHTNDRCKFKNGTWNSNNLTTPRNKKK